MQKLASGWTFDAERGPDWLFVRLHGPDDLHSVGNELADRLWALLQQHFTYRLVLELDELSALRSNIIGQLVLLHKRIHQHAGLMRICGLSDQCREILRTCRLDRRLPQYRNREEAVMGYRPAQPR